MIFCVKPIAHPNNEHTEGEFNGGTQCKKRSKHRQHKPELLYEALNTPQHQQSVAGTLKRVAGK